MGEFTKWSKAGITAKPGETVSMFSDATEKRKDWNPSDSDKFNCECVSTGKKYIRNVRHLTEHWFMREYVSSERGFNSNAKYVVMNFNGADIVDELWNVVFTFRKAV